MDHSLCFDGISLLDSSPLKPAVCGAAPQRSVSLVHLLFYIAIILVTVSDEASHFPSHRTVAIIH